MYKKILVPIDPAHIDEAQPTIDLAEHLMADDGSILLLSVVEDIPSYVASQIPENLLAEARTKAETALDSLVKQRNADYSTLVASGHAAATIKETQQKFSCDLIIISSHKPTTVDYVLGSTASKVVRRAQCPVFVTR